jgi:hypothetical protein
MQAGFLRYSRNQTVKPDGSNPRHARRIDNRARRALSASVHPARRIAAILLMALWLPALLHCRLEAAGLAFGAECCDDAHGSPAADSEPCADDSCDVAEGDFTKPTSSSLAAPAPILCTCLIFPAIISSPIALSPPPVTGVAESAAAPPEIARSWVFVSRAALPPRAPSLV